MVALRLGLRAGRKSYRRDEAIALALTVRNVSKTRLFVVAALQPHHGPPYIWRSAPDAVPILLAEDNVPDGFCYYGYWPPELFPLAPGARRTIPLHVGMPPRVGRIENNHYVWKETPVSGTVTIDVVVGYLTRPFRPKTAAPWAEFVAQQQTVGPVNVTVHVSP
jgi:hypothetical protein